MFDAPLEAIRDWGAAAIASLIFVWGTLKEWWVFGPQHRRMYEQMKAQNKLLYDEMVFWRGKALEGVGLAEKTLDVAGAP